MNYPAIVVQNISKRYRIGLADQPRKTLVDTLLSTLSSPINNWRRLRQLTRFENQEQDDIIWALKDVSFSVEPGEVVGIIGRNGAGKSTLLKVISRITHPTSGRLELRGQVSSLLEVGTGFHPELTGRENVFLNGTILGMRRQEIERKFDEIVDFSGVEKFIDTPIKRYSTGMRVRLAFSVAAHLEPEILLVDEVLAVGDAEFQEKSLGKMKNVAKHGRTVLFVSHQMDAIRTLCPRTILLADGQIVADGETPTIIDKYKQIATASVEGAEWHGEAHYGSEDRGFTLLSVVIHDKNGTSKNEFLETEEVNIAVTYRLDKVFRGLGVKILLTTSEGSMALTSLDTLSDAKRERGPGTFTSTCTVPAKTFNQHTYIVYAWARISTGQLLTKTWVAYASFSVHRLLGNVSIVEPFLGPISPYLPKWQVGTRE